MKKVICQSCGSEAVPQSDEIMNGREDMFACKVCLVGGWQELGDQFQEEEECEMVKCDICKKTIVLKGFYPTGTGRRYKNGMEVFTHKECEERYQKERDEDYRPE